MDEWLRNWYELEIRLLQAICFHPTKSEWMRQMWAPGHFTEYEVRLCRLCGKQLEERKVGLDG